MFEQAQAGDRRVRRDDRRARRARRHRRGRRASSGRATSTAGRRARRDEARDAEGRHAATAGWSSSAATSPAPCRAGQVAPTLQAALDDWARCAPRLEAIASTPRARRARDGVMPFDPAAGAWRRCRAPTTGSTARPTSTTSSSCARRATPRCRRASGPIRWCTRAARTTSSGRRTTCAVASEEYGIDLEAEVAVITDDVPMGVTGARGRARPHQAAACWSTTGRCAT